VGRTEAVVVAATINGVGETNTLTLRMSLIECYISLSSRIVHVGRLKYLLPCMLLCSYAVSVRREIVMLNVE